MPHIWLRYDNVRLVYFESQTEGMEGCWSYLGFNDQGDYVESPWYGPFATLNEALYYGLLRWLLYEMAEFSPWEAPFNTREEWMQDGTETTG